MLVCTWLTNKDPPNAGMYLVKKHGIVVLKNLEIKNSNSVFTFTIDDNSQDTFATGDSGIFVLVIDSSHKLKWLPPES